MPDRLVYSTDGGRVTHCPVCHQPYRHCRCESGGKLGKPASTSAPGGGGIRVSRERAQRGGKTVTVIRGLPISQAELETLARNLKRLCGAGGTVKEGTIEIQGDHCDKILAHLQQLGYRAKRAGG
ncbi:translation initiation factor [Thermogemmatispora tikiterensis]|uniref:Translation initiation factor SUI1 n=1 Tax=Thermogemmatispora tikiterensis TaxID=1825093 RepID=A0A328VHZ9_9CHLR|nr:stress response translation initiation inhibitor YciH [Thermogemmatispora tikiterensis]RAQ97396.1 translation initiation factor SUI1 [Thermogemmatispora tikiterensis]